MRNFIFVLVNQAALTLRTITNDSEHMFNIIMLLSYSSYLHIQKVTRDAYWKHISNIFSFETESPDPGSPRKNEKADKFWSFVKSLKNDAFGINALRENEILKTDTLDKAPLCNRQFQSAFTRESDTEIPSKGTSPFTPMGEITVDPNGVLKLLNNLKIHKASGRDGLSARVLKECSSEIAPILALIFNKSLAQGTVRRVWYQRT